MPPGRKGRKGGWCGVREEGLPKSHPSEVPSGGAARCLPSALCAGCPSQCWGPSSLPGVPWPRHWALGKPTTAPSFPSPAPCPPGGWVGGPHSPPGQKAHSLPGKGEEARPLGPAPSPSTAQSGSYLLRPPAPSGQTHLHLGPSIYSWLCGRPGWQIFGDCIVIADWANRARLL